MTSTPYFNSRAIVSNVVDTMKTTNLAKMQQFILGCITDLKNVIWDLIT